MVFCAIELALTNLLRFFLKLLLCQDSGLRYVDNTHAFQCDDLCLTVTGDSLIPGMLL
jgi:hypothetical protein